MNSRGNKKILVVEDEKDIIDLFLAIFDDPGKYQILSAMDGEEALRLAKVENPDIILLDIHLLKLDGYQVCESIKSNQKLCNTKIIMLSGMTQDYYIRKAREAGADGYIAKPFSSIELLKKVEELLRYS